MGKMVSTICNTKNKVKNAILIRALYLIAGAVVYQLILWKNDEDRIKKGFKPENSNRAGLFEPMSQEEWDKLKD